jgi:hypothetical protein
MGVISFVAILVLVLVALAFAIGMLARGWPLRMDDITLRGIDVERARDVVAMYLENVHDTRFGFPTGVFRIDERRSTPTKLVAREVNFGGGTGFRIVRFGILIPMELVAATADAGCFAAMAAFFIGCFFVGIFILPIFCVAVVEFILRLLMRSEITTELEPVSADHDACRVRFTLRGLSAFGVRRELQQGLTRPVLPVAYGGLEIDNAPETWSNDRLNLVYAGGIGIAVVIAAIVVAVSPSLRGTNSTSSASYGYVGSDYSDSSGYDSSSSSSDESSDSSSSDSSSGSTSSDASSSDGSSSGDESSDASSGDQADEPDGQSASSADLTINAAHAAAFTIHPPSGWSRESGDEQHDGFVESLWRSPEDSDVYFLVDDTPGYAHSAHYGAQDVRKLYLHGRVSDYSEWAFAPTTLAGYDAQRWEYEHRGLHKVDTFVTACGTGYAILGSAPIDSWDDYADMYEAATDSFRPSCDSSTGDSSSSGESSDDSSEDSTSSSDSTGETLSPEAVLRAHYNHLDAGEYAAAFALMSPRYRRALPRWPANRATADPGIDLIDMGPTRIRGSEAFVAVTFFARDRVNVKHSDTKCRRFEGTAHLRRFGTVWRYDPPDDYSVRVVHRSNPACP